MQQKIMVRWFVAILACLLMECQKTIDEQPQILGLVIAGIPQQNITIDQDQRRITVALPSILPALLLPTSFTLSPQTQLSPYWTQGKKGIDLTAYCPSLGWKDGQMKDLGLEVNAIVSNKTQTNTYTIQLKSAAALRIKPLTSPLVYDSKGTESNLVVPVENYYGSSYIEYIAVTRTGALSPNWIGPGGGRMEHCAGLLNEVKIGLAGYKNTLQPGLYDLDLWLANGTKVHASSYIVVK